MGIGPWQIALIVLVIVLLFGAGKIPRLAKDLGSGINAFKKGLKDTGDSGEGDKDDAKAIEQEKTETAKSSTTATSSAETEEKDKAKAANG